MHLYTMTDTGKKIAHIVIFVIIIIIVVIMVVITVIIMKNGKYEKHVNEMIGMKMFICFFAIQTLVKYVIT